MVNNMRIKNDLKLAEDFLKIVSGGLIYMAELTSSL